MSVAGVAAGQGKLSLAPVIASGTVGAMLGNVAWYWAARALGTERFHRFVDRHGKWLTMDWAEVQRAERHFEHMGVFFVMIGRVVPTIRSLVSIPAGLLRMSFLPFLVASTIGTAAWTAILAFAGYQLQNNVAEVDKVIGPISNAVIVVLVVGYLWRLVRFRLRRGGD
ncbi:DedA family protein [Sphingomonas piscis]|nr:DedA family protein [Sphingomonas piscis]